MEKIPSPSQESLIPEEVKISSSAPHVRVFGSSPSIRDLLLARPPDGDGPSPGPGTGGDHPPPAPAVSTPDIAFQFSPCLPDQQREGLLNSLRTAIGSDADKRAQCGAGHRGLHQAEASHGERRSVRGLLPDAHQSVP